MTVVGPARSSLNGDFELTATAAQGGIAVAAGAVPWEELGGARLVLATDLGGGETPFSALATATDEARAAGWRVAHAGLLHTGAAGARREGSLLVACRPQDPIAQALACGPLGLALDPAATDRRADPRAARVLIASHEITGPTGNGGIGTAYHSLAHTLADAGHQVTILFTGWLDPEQAGCEPRWRSGFAEAGIDFRLLGTPWDVPVRNPHHQVRRAYELHRWLAEEHAAQPFDVVHVPEVPGHAAFALTAKRLGAAYHDLEFVVGTHSSTRWVAESNRESIEQLDDLVSEQLERTSVELADVVMSPTAYMLDYMRERGWSLPERTFVQPLARPRAVRELAGKRATAHAQPRELVFFGRLETRKGLEAFCDAVDLLTADGDCPYDRVTLLGRPEPILGGDATSYVTRRAAAWGIAWTILPDLGHDEAIAHLRDASCVVAIPSLVDNSPNTVIETVALGVPFVVSRSGGTGELIAVSDLASSSFDGWRGARGLEPPAFSDAREPFDAEALAAALRAKASETAAAVSPSVDDAACDSAYDLWHRAIAGRPRETASTPPYEPLTAAVCIVAADAAAAARVEAAIASGTHAPARIVAIVEEAEPGAPTQRDSVVVRAADRDAGQIRRRVCAELDADVLIVVRGNEQPDPVLVERVLDAMRTGDAEVLSLVTRDHDAGRSTDTPEHLRRKEPPRDLTAFVPIAGPAVAGALYPAFSVGPYAIRRSALAALGGYSADAVGGAVDRELLSRAALAGVQMRVLPDPLATVVDDDEWVELRSRYWGSAAVPAPRGEEQISLLRPYRRQLDGSVADLPALLAGTLRVASRSAERAREEAVERDEIVAAYERRLTEHRELIELYERQKEELRAALGSSGARGTPPGPESPGRVLAWRVRRRIERMTRRLR